jgi:hypothetical protein
VVDALLPRGSNANTVPKLGVENLKQSSLLKLAEQMGQEMSPGRAGALRESAQLPPGDYLDRPDRQDPHARGEVLVAAVLRAFLKVWAKRIESLGTIATGQVDRQRVVEDGAGAAKNLLTMVIRSIDYAALRILLQIDRCLQSARSVSAGPPSRGAPIASPRARPSKQRLNWSTGTRTRCNARAHRLLPPRADSRSLHSTAFESV